jgi:hypothetical protein
MRTSTHSSTHLACNSSTGVIFDSYLELFNGVKNKCDPFLTVLNDKYFHTVKIKIKPTTKVNIKPYREIS